MADLAWYRREFLQKLQISKQRNICGKPMSSGCTFKRKKGEWRQKVLKVTGEDLCSKSPFLYPSCRDEARLNHSGTQRWGAGNRMAATPRSLWSLLFGCRLTLTQNNLFLSWQKTQQLTSHICSGANCRHAQTEVADQVQQIPAAILWHLPPQSTGKYSCSYHSPQYKVLVMSSKVLTKATASTFVPCSNFLLPITAQELFSPWAWDKATATSARPHVAMCGRKRPLSSQHRERALGVLQAEGYWSDSFQMGDVWLRGGRLFLGTASASSRWMHNSPPLPAPTVTLAALVPTEQHAVQLWPIQHR